MNPEICCRASFPMPFAARVYLYARRVWERPSDGGCYILSRSTPELNMPPGKGRAHRVDDYASGQVIRAAASRQGFAEGEIALGVDVGGGRIHILNCESHRCIGGSCPCVCQKGLTVVEFSLDGIPVLPCILYTCISPSTGCFTILCASCVILFTSYNSTSHPFL